MLVAYLHETELDALDAPLLIQRQEVVELMVERTLVDVYPHSDALAPGILAYLGHGEVALCAHSARIAANFSLRAIPSGIQLYVWNAEIGTEVYALHNGSLVKPATTEHLGRAHPRPVALGTFLIEAEHYVLVVDEVDGLLACHDNTPRGIVGRDDIGTAVHRDLQLVVLLQPEFPSRIVPHGSLKQGNVCAIGLLEEQRTLTLEPISLERAFLVVSLRPLLVPCHCSLGHGETCLFARDMQEEAVGSLWEMIAEGYALIVGTYYYIHGVVLAFVVAAADAALPAMAILVVQHNLVVAVTYMAVLAIEGCPNGVYPHAVDTTQL